MPNDEGRSDIHRDMGRLEGRMDALEQRQSRFETRIVDHLHDINAKLESLTNTWVGGKGAWKAISVLACVVVFGSSVAMWGISEYRAWKVEDQIDLVVDDESAAFDPGIDMYVQRDE